MGLPDSMRKATTTVGDVIETYHRSKVHPAWEPIALGVVDSGVR